MTRRFYDYGIVSKSGCWNGCTNASGGEKSRPSSHESLDVEACAFAEERLSRWVKIQQAINVCLPVIVKKRNITTLITRHNLKLHCLLSIGGFSYFDYFQFRSVSRLVRFGFAENLVTMTSEVPQWLNEKFFEKVLRTAQGDKSLTVRMKLFFWSE